MHIVHSHLILCCVDRASSFWWLQTPPRTEEIQGKANKSQLFPTYFLNLNNKKEEEFSHRRIHLYFFDDPLTAQHGKRFFSHIMIPRHLSSMTSLLFYFSWQEKMALRYLQGPFPVFKHSRKKGKGLNRRSWHEWVKARQPKKKVHERRALGIKGRKRERSKEKKALWQSAWGRNQLHCVVWGLIGEI